MEGNDPRSTPPGPPPWPQHYPPTKPARQWLPVAIIVAAIIIATAVISAILLSRNTTTTAAPATPTAGAAEASSTCEAWPSTKAALNSIPALPAGWDWDTPNIDVYIANQSAAVNKALDLFEPEIAASDPPQVVEAAKTYVSERRLAMQKLVDRTFTSADGVPGNVALAKLDQACPAPTAGGGAPTQAGTTAAPPEADSSTCKAWRATKPAFDAIPALPAGWDWNTPNIATYISNRSAATTKALDLFEPKIVDNPTDVATAARGYVAAKHNEERMLADQTFTSADAVTVNAAFGQLNQVCGVS